MSKSIFCTGIRAVVVIIWCIIITMMRAENSMAIKLTGAFLICATYVTATMITWEDHYDMSIYTRWIPMIIICMIIITIISNIPTIILMVMPILIGIRYVTEPIIEWK
jgi:hypothetical protein